MSHRPQLKEYVMARLIAMVVVLFAIFSSLLVIFVADKNAVYMTIGFLALGFSVFIFAVYRGAKRMQKELTSINTYLRNLKKIDKIDYQTHFFTHEFEEINQNLMKVLKKSKKREDVKQRYNAKLKLKNRQREDMISAIAHEFRNPIASIMGYSQTLVEDSEIPEALREKFLGKIHNNGGKIEDLLKRLILWNKFESGEATLHPTKFDICTLIQELKESFPEKYSQRNMLIDGNTFTVEADRTLLEIVLKNLMENALKYSQEDICIIIKEGYISVVDTGMGISSEDITKVTKKFYRSSTQSWDNSMGLGLSIVKSILALHGTKLEIESKKGIGSSFSFQLQKA